MKQYQGVKEKYRDAILFFRLGDFYEMFGEDARTASKILQITLTAREKNRDEPVPMCGIPHFAADSYIAKLIAAGHKVAICEQMEDPKDSKGVVKREVVRVITPGTHTPEDPKENNYIACIYPQGRKHGMAVADVSTGEFIILETENPLADELARFEPREVVYPESLGQDLHYMDVLGDFCKTPADDFLFDYGEAYKGLLAYFRVSSLEAFGCEGFMAAVSAAGALLGVLKDSQRQPLSFKKLTALRESSCMFLDARTVKNLELVQNLRDGGKEGTLLWALDVTLTPMGGRYLRGAILRPLVDLMTIDGRLSAVGRLFEDYELIDTLRGVLRKVQDVERLAAKLQMGSINARDLVALKHSLKGLPKIKKALAQAAGDVGLFKEMEEEIGEFSALIAHIDSSIAEHPPPGLREGGIIREGYHAEVDELRRLCTSSRHYIAGIEAEEREKTGINSLKVGFNKIFGYYIEITKSNLPQVPERYIRKQTLVGAERFITPELKEYETKALGAEEKLKGLEHEVFQGVVEKAQAHAQGLAGTAGRLGELDFLVSLAVVAKRHNYSMPRMEESLTLQIEGGRHPVIERLSQASALRGAVPLSEKFIPNDLSMDGHERRMLIITGPNMAGKSTYMRQNALIVLLAQMGSFVPADEAAVGIADRVFTRIGAADFLSMGQSTFMVEMLETANIIHNATKRSLLVLDEVGRGTSTFDGISIAWAAAEFISKKLRARTLFATHYHELTELGSSLEGVKNCNVAVREWGDEIIFLRKIEEGPSDKSYGIQVARLAGLPEEIVEKAKSVLANLEKQALNASGLPKFLPGRAGQMNLFGGGRDIIAEELLGLPEDLSAEEALRKLLELKRKAREEK